MKDVITWLENNKEWVFSGIGVAVISFVGTVIFRSANKTSSADNTVTQNNSVVQSPAVIQAPVVNITNNVGSADKPSTSTGHARPTNQVTPNNVPFFTLHPLVTTRDLMTITGNSCDDAVEVCIARFKMHDVMAGWIPNRFEVSIDYVERLNASGFPYNKGAGYINPARWLPTSGDVHELILIMRRGALYGVNGNDHDNDHLGDGSLVELDLASSKVFATVVLIDVTNGKKWRNEYEITVDYQRASCDVRETVGLHRA